VLRHTRRRRIGPPRVTPNQLAAIDNELFEAAKLDDVFCAYVVSNRFPGPARGAIRLECPGPPDRHLSLVENAFCVRSDCGVADGRLSSGLR
jgi:hypothetical protein